MQVKHLELELRQYEVLVSRAADLATTHFIHINPALQCVVPEYMVGGRQVGQDNEFVKNRKFLFLWFDLLIKWLLREDLMQRTSWI